MAGIKLLAKLLKRDVLGLYLFICNRYNNEIIPNKLIVGFPTHKPADSQFDDMRPVKPETPVVFIQIEEHY